jgi:hypothetical protein
MQSLLIYRGPSLIDGGPIVAVATYTDGNTKTGAVVQTYILRADMVPTEANKTGADVSICGGCPLKGRPTSDPARGAAEGRACYVNLAHGPLAVWKALQRGRYPAAQGPDDTAAMGAGRVVRLGTYGDPGAVPLPVWQALLSRAQAWTGYTHTATSEALYGLVMASVESLPAAQAHWATGRRTFRIVSSVADLVPGREVLCPASTEAGKRTTCRECKLCAGTATRSDKSIAIVAHGRGRKFVGAGA